MPRSSSRVEMQMTREKKGGEVAVGANTDPSGLVKLSSNNDYVGELHSPYAVQVLIEAAEAEERVMAAGAGGGRGSLSAVAGIVGASTAVTALASGVVSPAVAFGSFLILLGGLALAMASVGTPRRR